VRSQPSRWFARAMFALVVITGSTAAPAMETIVPVQSGAQPTVRQIQEALEQVREDPQLGTERKARILRWKSDDSQPPEDAAGWMKWLEELFRWIAGSARMILWVLAGVLAAFIVIYILRLLHSRAAAGRGESFIAPSHVRDLDIRPESLPADIGGAALQLWESGEQRRALALLYRGLLSRMVHAHGAAVRDSTTEGECIVLARGCLPQAASEFASSLVVTWQRAVYGGLLPETQHVRRLCTGFSASLDPVDAGATAR
jgi:hypothetical protein